MTATGYVGKLNESKVRKDVQPQARKEEEERKMQNRASKKKGNPTRRIELRRIIIHKWTGLPISKILCDVSVQICKR